MIDVIINKLKLGLGEYVLEDNEWMLVKQLYDVLKVCGHMTLVTHADITVTDTQGCNILLLTSDPKPCDSHPSHGLYQ